MRKIIDKHRRHFSDKSFLASSLMAMALLLFSLLVNLYAGTYATDKASNAVTDIVLSNIRVYDVDGVFVYGSIIFWIFISFLCLREPKIIPFTLKTIALFVLIRSVFISLTHIGPFPDQAAIDSNLLAKISFGGDLFFSGHVGLAFLMALVFWADIRIRLLSIAAAILFGLVVLMAHFHYSIDVLAAFFITYTIYHLAEVFFKKDLRIFNHGIES